MTNKLSNNRSDLVTKLSNTTDDLTGGLPTSLAHSAFIAWLKDRLSHGETYAAIGRSLGVTHAGVRRWIVGKSGVSLTVLLLAERIMLDPRDLRAGLPDSNPRSIGG